MQAREIWCSRCGLWYRESDCLSSVMNDPFRSNVPVSVITSCPARHSFIYVPDGVSVRFVETE